MLKKLLLISGSNPSRTPFIGFYQKILEQNNIDYDVLYWNRDGKDPIINNNNYIVYNRPLYIYSNPLKKLYSTYKFYKYGKDLIERNGYSNVICFTIMTSIFFYHYLGKKYRGKYIFDIRDHSPMIQKHVFWYMFESLIRNSYATVISSRGFEKWLPKNRHYVISHNTDRDLMDREMKQRIPNRKIEILTIGFFVRFEPNGFLLNSFKDNPNVTQHFVGFGPYYSRYREYCKKYEINNVRYSGRYSKDEEIAYYDNCDMVNILLTSNLNSDTCMSNRFYNAVISRKPMIVNDNCYQAELVRRYNLGIVISDFNELDKQILNYYYNLDWNEFYDGCEKFLSDIKSDYDSFIDTVLNLVKS